MAESTHIEWTDATWNPITGCSVVSPGCTNCYAMKLAGTRLRDHPSRAGLTQPSKSGPVWTGEVRFNAQWLGQPLNWRKPRMIFVCAHADLFHPAVPDAWIDQIFAVMALTPQHTHQVLTKRSERMRAYISDPAAVRRICTAAREIHSNRKALTDEDEFSVGNTRRFKSKMKDWWDHVGKLTAWTKEGGAAAELFTRKEPGAPFPSWVKWPLPNVWLGVSVEDQARADQRIPDLLATPAAVRWISVEPMLGPIDLSTIDVDGHSTMNALRPSSWREVWEGDWAPEVTGTTLEEAIEAFVEEGGVYPPTDDRATGLNWVVVGGESADHARPMHPDWARNIRDQCRRADVPFFFKQWGSWKNGSDFAADAKVVLNDGRVVTSDRATLEELDSKDYPLARFNPTMMRLVGKKAAGDLLDDHQYHQMAQRADYPGDA